MMTDIRNILVGVLACLSSFIIASCSDDNQPARTPSLNASVSKTSLEINESMEIRFTGVADQIVVYTGDKDHQYEKRDSSNTGFTANKGLFTYSYRNPGTFHVVCIASTYDTYLGGSLQTVMTTFDVTVTDDVTTIAAISSTITPNVFYAEQISDRDWVLRLPLKQLYNNREISVNAARQRLNLTIESDSARVFIDGEAYNARNYYALNVDHDIQVISASGSIRDYRLYGLTYPEFTVITVGGQEPALSRSAYYQDLLTYTVGGDDLTLDYSVDSDVQLLDGTSVLPTGSRVKLDYEYTLRRTHTADGNAVADTRVIFTK